MNRAFAAYVMAQANVSPPDRPTPARRVKRRAEADPEGRSIALRALRGARRVRRAAVM